MEGHLVEWAGAKVVPATGSPHFPLNLDHGDIPFKDLEPFQEQHTDLHGRKPSLPLPHASRNWPSRVEALIPGESCPTGQNWGPSHRLR